MAQDAQPRELGAEARPLGAHRGKLLVVSLLLVLGLGYFAYTAFQGSTVYYLTVSELVNGTSRSSDKIVRVSGKLVPESFQRDGGSPVARFDISDGVHTLKASYRGVVPDLFFNKHSDIVLEGSYRPGGGFDAENVIVKCPSKYEAASAGS